jgi:hypothetical protein
MTYRADLSGTDRVRRVGYLARGYSFTKGTTSQAFFDRLVNVGGTALRGVVRISHLDLGWCRLKVPNEKPALRYKGHPIGLGNTDISVPGDEVVYLAPSLILHYIRRHRYLPPPCFVEAVLNCQDRVQRNIPLRSRELLRR